MFSLFPSRTVAIEILGFAVHWYGIMYLIAFLVAFFLTPRLQKFRQLKLPSDEWSRIISAAIVGVIVGGRLGYVFFYDPLYFFNNPLKIFAVWEGGMASHGGFIGVTTALLYVLRHRSWQDMLKIADTVSIPVILGLGIGRIGNFINQELYGTVTSLPWGVAIPGVIGLRHPVQLYETLLCFIIALVCYWHLCVRKTPGSTFGVFLTLYGIERILIEYLRIHQYQPVLLGFVREQLLTLPLLFIGLCLLFWCRNKLRNQA